MHVQPYLMFPGSCREAMTFYADALGGEIVQLQTVGESHLEWAPEHADRVFHSIFVADGLRFMASDGEPDNDPRIGENFAMFVTCPTPERQKEVFEALAAGGRVLFPLAEGFGMVEDRFQIRWMIAVGSD